jgi:membrane protein DedA with SNARE-associated domain
MPIVQPLAPWGLPFSVLSRFLTFFLLLLAEEAGVPLPVPGDALVALMGARSHRTPPEAVAVIATATVAVFCGSSLLYLLVQRGGRPLLERYGKYVHLTASRLARLDRWMQQGGPFAILIGRLIPGLRIPTTVLAGLANVPYRRFAPVTALSAVIWSAFYYWLGAFASRQAAQLAAFDAGMLDAVSDWVLLGSGVMLLLAVGALSYALWRRRRRSRQ